MKQVIIIVLLLFLSISSTTYAHQVKNSITRTTAITYSDDQQLSIILDISVPSSELDLVYNMIDLDNSRTITDQESNQFIELIKDKIYINYDSKSIKPVTASLNTPYKELSQVVIPTLEFKLNFGKVLLDQTPQNLTIFNKLKFNTTLPQDWNMSLDKNLNTQLIDIEFYPDKTIISEQLNLKISSNKGVFTPSFFKKITNNQLFADVKSYLRQPSYNLSSLIWILGICALFGAIHAFQPGHGKAIIGSYLSAINGTFKDSIIMAVSTTLSHTFIILLLSFIWALFKDGLSLIIPLIDWRITIPKEWINIPILASWIKNLASIGLLLTGIIMVLRTYKNYVDYKLAIRTGRYNEVKIDIDNNNPYSIIDHGDHKHYLPSQRLNLRQSIWLGINTGFTPCFDALILFTLALSLGLGWIGFVMLLIFSIGLGVSLTLVGYLSSKVINKVSTQFSRGEQIAVLLPILSSIAIIILAIINIIQ
jgi:nickel/cobalt transporter (NicO) family protein